MCANIWRGEEQPDGRLLAHWLPGVMGGAEVALCCLLLLPLIPVVTGRLAAGGGGSSVQLYHRGSFWLRTRRQAQRSLAPALLACLGGQTASSIGMFNNTGSETMLAG